MDYSLSQRSYSPSYKQFDNMSQTSNNISLKPIHLQCGQHPDEPSNNYCVQPKCYKPLCSECIQEHLLHHKKCGFSDLGVRSMRGVRKECIYKLTILIEQMMKRLEHLPQPPNSQAIFENILMKLDDAKKQAHRIIQEQFVRISQSLLIKVKESTSNLQIMADIHEKLQGLIQQLRQNLLTISQGKRQKFTVPQCIKTTLTLNDKALIDTFSKESLVYENILKKIELQISFNSNLLKTAINQSIILTTPKINNNSIKELKISLGNKYKQGFHNEQFIQEENSTLFNLPNRIDVVQYNKYLHFFQTGTNKLHLIQIENRKVLSSKVVIIDQFIVPSYHASLMSHQGDVVFLSGGSVGLNNKSKSPLLIKYMIRNKNMKKDFARVTPRSSHSLCQDKNGDIYILGGYGQLDERDQSEPITKVERVNQKTGKVQIQCESNWGGSNISFRYKEFILKACEEGVQLYNPKVKQWIPVETKIKFKNDYILNKSSGYANLSDDEFLIFGGYSGSEITPNDECYHWKLYLQNGAMPLMNITKLSCKLPIAEGFDNGKALIDEKGFLVLQNINDDEQQETCIDNQRMLLRFQLRDGSGQWKILNKISQQ